MCSNYPGIKLEPALGTQEDKIEHLSSYAHVVHTTAKQVISSRRKNENVFKMSKDDNCTCKACKNTVFHCQICKLKTFLLPSFFIKKCCLNSQREKSLITQKLSKVGLSRKYLIIPGIGQSLGTRGVPRTAQRYSSHQRAKKCGKRLDIRCCTRLSSSWDLEDSLVLLRHCAPCPLVPRPGLNPDRTRSP